MSEVELHSEITLHYFDTAGTPQFLTLSRGQLGFTYCQVPVVMSLASQPSIRIHWADGTDLSVEGRTLSAEQSEALFKKTGAIARLDVFADEVIK